MMPPLPRIEEEPLPDDFVDLASERLITEEELFAVHETYLEQITGLNEIISSFGRLLGRLELFCKENGNDIRTLVYRNTDRGLPPTGQHRSRDKYGNDKLTEDDLFELSVVLNKQLSMARDFQILLKHVNSDDNMASIWEQLMTMMRLLENSND